MCAVNETWLHVCMCMSHHRSAFQAKIAQPSTFDPRHKQEQHCYLGAACPSSFLQRCKCITICLWLCRSQFACRVTRTAGEGGHLRYPCSLACHLALDSSGRYRAERQSHHCSHRLEEGRGERGRGAHRFDRTCAQANKTLDCASFICASDFNESKTDCFCDRFFETELVVAV